MFQIIDMKLRDEAKRALEIIKDDYRVKFNEELDEEKIGRTLLEVYPIFSEGDSCEKRHWVEVQTIFRIGQHAIRASIARTTGDESAQEKGWIFDPNSMAEVFPVRVLVTRYKTLEEIWGRL